MRSIFKSLRHKPKHKGFKYYVERGALIIDVRSPAAFQRSHMEGAINIPLCELREKANMLYKSRPIVVVGMLSSSAAMVLNNLGFSKVYDAGSWSRLQKKVERKKCFLTAWLEALA